MLHKGIVTITNRKFHFLLVQKLHTNLLHKFGAEQINGKPKRKVKAIANYKAFRFVQQWSGLEYKQIKYLKKFTFIL